MTHALKIWPEYYKAVEAGTKNFEVRRNDRPYKIGDTLLLQEWSKEDGYTGKELQRIITYILPGNVDFGVFGDFCIIGMKDREY